jgi:hypothetical protein
MRSWLAISLTWACAVGVLSHCNLHSGSGQDPNAVINPEAGEFPDDGAAPTSDGGGTGPDAQKSGSGGGSSGTNSSGGPSSSSGGTGSNSGGNSGGGNSGGSSGSGTFGDASVPLDSGTGAKCSPPSGGTCSGTVAQYQACQQMLDAGQQACISCVQNACPGGAQDFNNYIHDCACMGGPCTGPCSGANDFCTIDACDPSNGCSAACVSCLNAVMATGAMCDPMGSQVSSCCNADQSCMRYEQAIKAFCP